MGATRHPIDTSRIDLAQGPLYAIVHRPRHLETLVERFVIAQNIEHYRAMLKIVPDPARHALITKLLFEQEALLKKYDDDHKAK